MLSIFFIAFSSQGSEGWIVHPSTERKYIAGSQKQRGQEQARKGMKINDKVIKQIGTMYSDLFCWNTYYVDLLFATDLSLSCGWNTCKRCELAYFMFWHCDSVGLTEFLLIIRWIEFEITSMYMQFVWGRGVFMLQMSTLPFWEQCRLSVTNLGFCAKLSWKEDKSVCLYEK